MSSGVHPFHTFCKTVSQLYIKITYGDISTFFFMYKLLGGNISTANS